MHSKSHSPSWPAAQQQAISYIGLGSNLGTPVETVLVAMTELAQLPQSKRLACSSLYRSEPIGPGVQGDYINAVVKIETQLPPNDLLSALQVIEQRHGRERNGRWTPRTLDLDILLYDQLQIAHEHLCIPHSQMLQRNFVLCPLLEIAADLTLPDGSQLTDRVAACPAGRLTKLLNSTP
jgi:2-amino-4-hydroxy-6-hydroxymethyldihydropteridine diphosphokinase